MKTVSPALLAALRGTLPDSLSAAEWESLAREAQTEGVAPLAFWNLSASGNLSALPSAARGALRAAYFQTWKRNRQIFQELEIFAQEFHRAEIPFAVLKGACFALTLYPDSGTRPMGDLDVLVPRPKWKECVKIAKALGYAEAYPEAAPGLNEALGHEISLLKPGAQAVLVEIHKNLLASDAFQYAAPMDWFWEQMRPLNHPRFPSALCLSPAAQLLYAAAHAMLQHGAKAAPLRWFADMHFLISDHVGETEWKVLLRQAAEFEWSSALEAALRQTRAYFETPIPTEVLSELSRRADRHQLLVQRRERKPHNRIQEELQKMAGLNALGKVRLLLALIFPVPSYMRWRYSLQSTWELFIYYPIRWRKILQEGLRLVFGFLKK